MAIPFPFESRTSPLDQRKHGPHGYAQYQGYKPWLRDEHDFRCVYCLAREEWERTGAEVFGVDHLIPKTKQPKLERKYDNLCYCCNRCNSRKNDLPLLPGLIDRPLDQHVQIDSSGGFQALSKEGEYLRDLLLLAHGDQVEWRKLILEMHKRAAADLASGIRTRFTRFFGFPDDLPDLRTTRPPSGNSRETGIETCAFVRRERGTLPEFY